MKQFLLNITFILQSHLLFGAAVDFKQLPKNLEELLAWGQELRTEFETKRAGGEEIKNIRSKIYGDWAKLYIEKLSPFIKDSENNRTFLERAKNFAEEGGLKTDEFFGLLHHLLGRTKSGMTEAKIISREIPKKLSLSLNIIEKRKKGLSSEFLHKREHQYWFDKIGFDIKDALVFDETTEVQNLKDYNSEEMNSDTDFSDYLIQALTKKCFMFSDTWFELPVDFPIDDVDILRLGAQGFLPAWVSENFQCYDGQFGGPRFVLAHDSGHNELIQKNNYYQKMPKILSEILPRLEKLNMTDKRLYLFLLFNDYHEYTGNIEAKEFGYLGDGFISKRTLSKESYHGPIINEITDEILQNYKEFMFGFFNDFEKNSQSNEKTFEEKVPTSEEDPLEGGCGLTSLERDSIEEARRYAYLTGQGLALALIYSFSYFN